ncbi:MAG: hypothetical protein ACTSWR_08425 [Candidatus Helarchaeota archaeon]
MVCLEKTFDNYYNEKIFNDVPNKGQMRRDYFPSIKDRVLICHVLLLIYPLPLNFPPPLNKWLY